MDLSANSDDVVAVETRAGRRRRAGGTTSKHNEVTEHAICESGISSRWPLGIVVLIPLYFLVDLTGRQYPAPTDYPQFFYGFLAVAMAWQIVFLAIGSNPPASGRGSGSAVRTWAPLGRRRDGGRTRPSAGRSLSRGLRDVTQVHTGRVILTACAPLMTRDRRPCPRQVSRGTIGTS
jgi:hypothetical protein